MTNMLIIKSDNPDWNGTFKKADILQEMSEVQCFSDNENAWIHWVLEHMFDNDELDDEAYEFISGYDQLLSVTLKVEDSMVTVSKF